MKKQLLFVINSLDCGGAEKSLISLLSLIDYSRYSIDLLMFNPSGMFMDLLPEQVHILSQPLFFAFLEQSIIKQITKPNWLAARYYLSAKLRINAKRGHTLHDTQVFWQCCGSSIVSLGKHYDAAVAWGQGNPTHYVAEKVRANIKVAWINADYEAVGHNKEFDYRYYKSFQWIVSVSDQLNEKMRSVFPEFKDCMKVVYDTLNTALVQEMAELEVDFRPDKEITIVTAGRLVKQKGYDIATVACKILKEQGLLFHWYIVGDGSERLNIEKDIANYDISDCMTLLGAKSNPYPYINAADIYVQTSRFEGYCLTLAEARMLNKPIVTTNFDVVYNQMIHGKNGLVVPMEPKAVADGIMRLVNDQQLRNSLIEFLKTEKKGNTEEIEKFYNLIGD